MTIGYQYVCDNIIDNIWLNTCYRRMPLKHIGSLYLSRSDSKRDIIYINRRNNRSISRITNDTNAINNISNYSQSFGCLIKSKTNRSDNITIVSLRYTRLKLFK